MAVSYCLSNNDLLLRWYNGNKIDMTKIHKDVKCKVVNDLLQWYRASQQVHGTIAIKGVIIAKSFKY